MKICNDSIRTAIDTGCEHITLSEAQKQTILQTCYQSGRLQTRSRPIRRALCVAAVFVLSACLCGGVLAASPELRTSLSMLSNAAIQQLQPVNQTSADEGIRMEVLAAVNDGKAAVVFLSLQDTEQKGRLDKTLELRDSEITGTSFTSSEVVDYNNETETAILRLISQDHEELANKKITVKVRSILSGYESGAIVPTEYTVAQLEQQLGNPALEAKSQITECMASGEGYPMYMEKIMHGDGVTILKKWDEPIIDPQMDWVQLNALGIFNNEVHVQTSPVTALGTVNRLHPDLLRADGTRLDGIRIKLKVGDVQSADANVKGGRVEEHVLVVPETEDKTQLVLAFSTETYQHYIKGNWSTTFKLETASERLEYECNTDMGGWVAQDISVSPIAVEVCGIGEMQHQSLTPNVQVYLKDGTELVSNHVSTMSGEDKITCRTVFNEVIDLTQVDRVLFNGKPL